MPIRAQRSQEDLWACMLMRRWSGLGAQAVWAVLVSGLVHRFRSCGRLRRAARCRLVCPSGICRFPRRSARASIRSRPRPVARRSAPGLVISGSVRALSMTPIRTNGGPGRSGLDALMALDDSRGGHEGLEHALAVQRLCSASPALSVVFGVFLRRILRIRVCRSSAGCFGCSSGWCAVSPGRGRRAFRRCGGQEQGLGDVLVGGAACEQFGDFPFTG